MKKSSKTKVKKKGKEPPVQPLPASCLDTNDRKDFTKDIERIAQYDKQKKPFLKFVFTVVYHVKLFLKKNSLDNINALAGQSAFFVILSVIPFLMLILSILSLMGGELDADQLSKVSRSYGSQGEFFAQFLKNAYESASSGTVVITAVMALWSSGKGMYILTDGISRIYHIPLKHFWVFRRVFAMGYTLVLLLMIVLYFGLQVVNIMLDQYVHQAIGNLTAATELLHAMRYVITTVITVLFLTLSQKLYLFRRVTDKRYAKFRVLLPGMIFTSVAWNLLGWGVGIYTTYFTSSLYGSFASLFVILMWLYFMLLLLLYGVQINFIYREQFYNFRLRDVFKKLKERITARKAKV